MKQPTSQLKLTAAESVALANAVALQEVHWQDDPGHQRELAALNRAWDKLRPFMPRSW